MPTEFVQKSFDIAVTDIKTNRPKVRLLESTNQLDANKEKALRCLVGLAGEAAPEVLPFSANYGLEEQSRIYRFDWMFGISLPFDERCWWDWQDGLRDSSAVAVQILISPGDSGFFFTDIATVLMALSPSRDSRSWMETHEEQLGKSLSEAAKVTTEITGQAGPVGAAGNTVSAILRASSVLSNFVASGKGRTKNWFIYRYLDAEENCCAVEWRINKRVLYEYGPLLRGSLLMTFHGSQSAKHDQGIKMLLRPMLGFHQRDEICYVRLTDALEREARPQLLIKPTSDSW